MKNGLPSGLVENQALEPIEPGRRPRAQQGCQQFPGLRFPQRVEPQLRVVRFAAPAVMVLRAVVD